MKRVWFRVGALLAFVAAAIAWRSASVVGSPGQSPAGATAGQSSARSTAPAAMPSTKNGEWPMYTADLRGSKYSPLDQIDATNFNKLEVAWRFKTDNLGPRPENKLEGTPIMVGGMVYTTGGTRRAVVALDAQTGELKWVYSMDEGLRAASAPRQLSGRGLSYWTDGKGDDRIVLRHDRLSAGGAEREDRPAGRRLRQERHRRPERRRRSSARTSRSISSAARSASTPRRPSSTTRSSSDRRWPKAWAIATAPTPRASSARSTRKTGKQIWRFNTIPYPGELGQRHLGKRIVGWTGNDGVWTQITVDPEAGLVYLPVESPTIDTYGGNRPGNNLFAETLVAVDLKTGVRKWHFQLVHHPIWDHDISSAPLLVDAVIDGRPRKLVAQPTKQSFLYVFDRITGAADLADAGDRRCRRPMCRARRRRRRSRFRPSRRPTRARMSPSTT